MKDNSVSTASGSLTQPAIKRTSYLRLAWLLCYCGFCLCFTFAIAYSQILLGGALFFLAIDAFISDDLALTRVEKKVYALIGAFILLSCISSIANDSPLESLMGLREEWLFLLIPLSARVARQPGWSRRALSVGLISVALLSTYGWMQHFLGFTFRPDLELIPASGGFYRAWGNFHNTLTYGNLFAPVSVFLLTLSAFARRNSQQLILAGVGLLAAGATVMTYSRGSIVALAVGIILFALLTIKRSRKTALLILGVSLAGFLALAPSLLDRFLSSPESRSSAQVSVREMSISRPTVWRTSWRIVKENPLLGVGPGNFRLAYESAADSTQVVMFSHAHNDVLNVAAYAGLPTALVYTLLWLVVCLGVYRVARSPEESPNSLSVSPHISPPISSSISLESRALATAVFCGSVVFFVSSLTEASFADEEVRMFLMAMWGFGLWATDQVGAVSGDPN